MKLEPATSQACVFCFHSITLSSIHFPDLQVLNHILRATFLVLFSLIILHLYHFVMTSGSSKIPKIYINF